MNTFSFVAAASNSGKTTLIEKIVRLLKARGLKVAVIKRASEGFESSPQVEELETGSEWTMIVGPDRTAMIRHVEQVLTFSELQKCAGDVDIIIYEGFTSEAVNKIEVFRYGVSGHRPLCMDDPSIIALATDRKFDFPILQFDLNDAEAVAAYLIIALPLNKKEQGEIHLYGPR